MAMDFLAIINARPPVSPFPSKQILAFVKYIYILTLYI
jgi:hypothetical protein